MFFRSSVKSVSENALMQSYAPLMDIHIPWLLQVQVLDQLGKIVSVRVHVVAVPWLARPAMTAAIMRNHAISLVRQEHHLRVPCIGAQRPAMRESDGLPCAPVLVIDLC